MEDFFIIICIFFLENFLTYSKILPARTFYNSQRFSIQLYFFKLGHNISLKSHLLKKLRFLCKHHLLPFLGVAAGSMAATVQSVIYGGATTGAFSILQSAGAAGIAASTSAGIGVTAGVTSAAIAARLQKFKLW